MGKRVITLFLACAAFFSTVAVAPAQAACRPTTLADLFPPAPATSPPVELAPPAPLIPHYSPGTAAGSTTSTTATSTTTTIDANDASTTTTTIDPATTTTIDPATTPAPTTAPAPLVPAPIPVARCSYVYRMQWPVLGNGAVLSVFGAERDLGARRHAGIDISAPKMTPVVAVRDGTVKAIHDDPGDCCWLGITHDDGWSSWYLHLNNDVDGSDDGDGIGIRPNLVVGSRVLAGEVIGWVGDSGNAEPATPHLHFELHMRNGIAIDPLASLRWAFRRMPPPALEGMPASFSGPFIDDDGSPAESIFGLLASLGAVSWCDSWNAAVCPNTGASSAEAVSWIGAVSRVLVPVSGPESSTEIVQQILEQSLNCPIEGCPPSPIIAGEAAAILLWAQDQRAHDDAIAAVEEMSATDPEADAVHLVPPLPAPYWQTDPAVALSRLAGRGLADDCPVATRPYNEILTRASLAEMIGKAYGYLPVLKCGAVA